ncbi:hypothetical protein [Bosea sp. NBC_00550]|uniref:hypothetical protein n=1 Tax=Bosea sp. NBC_00550 TaxID=2969621 RepID=UPI0029FEED8B|nr:hypothetical protein [Bosea sp. NBC_00550]
MLDIPAVRIARLVEEGVDPIQYVFGDARRLSEPNWDADQKDVARILRLSTGQSSPSPSSEDTPGCPSSASPHTRSAIAGQSGAQCAAE